VGRSFVAETLSKMKSGHRPYFVTDGYRVYNEAMERIYGEWSKKPYGGRGRPPVFKFGLPEDLNYGQVVKTRKGKRLESVEYIQVSGAVPQEYLNTSSVERMNLTVRSRMARMKRSCRTFSKNIDMLNLSVDVFRALYNLCSPHSSLGKKVTPGMELGITDEVWSVRKLMSFSYRNNID